MRKEFVEELKVDSRVVDRVVERKKFLKAIDGNREILDKLSIKQLEILQQYYDKIIKENEIKIKKLQASM